MPRKILIILFLFLSNLLFGQEWSEPLLISTMQGYNDDPDFCIDSNGVIHCVWSHEIETNFRKIYYSKSENSGEAWTEPEDISLNDSMWMSNPHVECDSENNLYLSYDYNTGDPNQMLVLLKKFNGISWSNFDTISEGMLGSDFNRLVIDNNDRVYIFWFYYEKVYYRYLENEVYSDIVCPYCGNSDLYFLSSVISDKNNNLHCIGRYLKDGNYAYDIKAIYFKYDFFTDLWQGKHFLSENRAWAGSDICIDRNQQPHLAWHEPTTEAPPYNDATFYTYFNGYNWAPNEIVVEDPKYQTIAIDFNNRVHIANQEKTEEGVQLVHYQKQQSSWEGQIVDTAQNLTDLKLIYNKNKLFLLYDRYRTNQGNSIFFSKFDVLVNIQENTIKYHNTDILEQNYPNPFQNQTVINFYLNKSGYTTLTIINLQGCTITTLINEHKSFGEYNIIWDGTNLNGNKVTPGIYLYRLQVNNRVITRSLMIY